MKKLIFLFIILLLITNFVFSADFGILADQKIEADSDIFSYTPSLAPWFSWTGNNLSLYFSGLLSFKYNYNYTDGAFWQEPLLLPEITRFAFNYRNGGFFIEAGRIAYNDLLTLTASGFFDGIFFQTGISTKISACVLYTGFQYKETAKIAMTDDDIENYIKPFSIDNINDYFASKRLLAAIRLDLPVGLSSNFSAEILAQFDLNGSNQPFHSQYGAVRMEFYPFSMMRITAAAIFETMQKDGDFSAAFGALGSIRTALPTPINDWLTFTVKFTSSSVNEAFSAFTPLTSIPIGNIFPNSIAGVTLAGMEYTARINKYISAEISFNYYMQSYDFTLAKVNFYGGETWASLIFQPLEDVRITLGGGAFFHNLGNMESSDAVTWKILAGLTLSF